MEFLSLSRRRSSRRIVPGGEELEETAVFTGYPWRQLFTTHRVWYEFNIFSKSDYKKRWADLYITQSTEYWNCKAGFWFLKLNVGCTTYMLCILVECFALNFQERVIMLNVESLS